MKIESSDVKSNTEELELYSDNYPFNLPLRISNFENESEYGKFIKSCEKIIRTCPEYKQWRSYITDVLGIQTCCLTNEIMEETSIAIHHHIPSLYSITKAMINKRISEEQRFSSLEIALDVMTLHFENRVGFLPIINSLHEKFHNGCLKIPVELVKGDYSYFIDHYMQYLDDTDKEIITERLAVRLENFPTNKWDRDHYPGLITELIDDDNN